MTIKIVNNNRNVLYKDLFIYTSHIYVDVYCRCGCFCRDHIFLLTLTFLPRTFLSYSGRFYLGHIFLVDIFTVGIFFWAVFTVDVIS